MNLPKVNKIVHLGIKLAVFSLAVVVIYIGISQFLESNEDVSKLILPKNASSTFFLVFILMFMNWLIEAIKWQYLITSVQKIDLGTALSAVLTGVTFGLITPNKLGSFVGQVLYVSEDQRKKASWSTLYGNYAQMVVTFTFGTVALGLLLTGNLLGEKYLTWLKLGFVISLILNVVIILVYFNSSKLWGKIKFLKKIGSGYKDVIFHQSITDHEKWKILLLSSMRYIVFVLQYYLLLLLFDIQLSAFEAFVMIALTFFILNFIPAPFLGKLGVRESVALFVIGPYCDCELQAVVASFILWIVNLAIPGIIGSILLLKLNLKKKSNA